MSKQKVSAGGFPVVRLSNVSIAKAINVKEKCELSLKLELDASDAVQLASFAHRGAHLKMVLTEFDPELPLPAGE